MTSGKNEQAGPLPSKLIQCYTNHRLACCGELEQYRDTYINDVHYLLNLIRDKDAEIISLKDDVLHYKAGYQEVKDGWARGD